jgi:hypothetical protein
VELGRKVIFIEYHITNMNEHDTLYDIAMGMYMDADIGPSWFSPDDRSMDDVSGYVRGADYEFAYSRDFDTDGGLSMGWVATTLISPGINCVEFAGWFWNRGDGPDDRRPRVWGFGANQPRRTLMRSIGC